MIKNKVVLGIDPGEKGSLCCLECCPEKGLNSPEILFFDYKDTLTAFGDLGQLGTMFDILFVVIEKQWFRGAEFEKDVKSTEKLIRNSEMWMTVLEIYNIRYLSVAPATWRNGLLRKKSGKKEAISKAKEIFPGAAITRHDEAEAALMAYRAYQHVRAGAPTILEVE